MEKSESIKNLTEALIKFQEKMKPLEFDAEVEVSTSGGKFKFKYATLQNIIENTRKPLAENGFAIVQTIGEGGAVTTILLHSSGEWIQDTVLIAPVKSSPQAIGSSITYAKRYSLASMLRLITETDEDGNLAEGNEVQFKETPKIQNRNNDPRAWLKEELYQKACEFLRSGEEYIEVKGEGQLDAKAFTDYLFKTYKMKRMWMEQLNQLSEAKHGSLNPVK